MTLGIFDSGVGGLTVLGEVRRQLPDRSVLYFADTARLPYGGRSAEEIRGYVGEILAWFSLQGVERVLMACNTSSALALDTVGPEFAFPVAGLIRPAAALAVRRGCRIGVIATEATARSQAYTRAIRALAPEVRVWEMGCPEFVPIIEGGRLHEPRTRQIVGRRLQPLLDRGIDTLIYGCTHYPFLASILDGLLPDEIVRIDPAVAAVAELAGQPGSLPLSQATFRYCVSGDPDRFAGRAEALIGARLAVEAVQLPRLVCA